MRTKLYALRDQLAEEIEARRRHHRYAESKGFTKYDCGLVITAFGQALGYRVAGLGDWPGIVLPGQLNPSPNRGEQVIPYLDRPKTRADYVWFDAQGRCVAVFETDGRDNNPKTHLRETAHGIEIKPHKGTNNFYKLSHHVLRRCFGYVPPLRYWVLFQIDNDFSPKNPWGSAPAIWNSLVARCRNTPDEAGLLPENPLEGLQVLADTDILTDAFLDAILAGRPSPVESAPLAPTPPAAKPVKPPVVVSPRPPATGHAPITSGAGSMGQLGLELVRRYMRTPHTWAEALRDLGHTDSGTPIKPGARFLTPIDQIRDPKRYYPDTFFTSDGVPFRVSREWQRCYFENLVARETQLRESKHIM